MAIKRLDVSTINQIRAGEVVERPVSAIRELVDNAIDANSTEIKINFSAGGKRFHIIDNGDGIHYNDIPLVLEKHATSKLDDINNISTYGFRGEALASIAHVAEIKIVTRIDGEDAWSVTNDAVIVPSSGSKGTSVYVTELFQNFPARREFLKSDSYESGLIKREITEFALAHPNICFDLSQSNKSIFRYNNCDSFLDRVIQVYGSDFINNSIHVQDHYADVCFEIFVPEPTWDKNGSIGQHIFVNGRSVKYPLVSNALKASYSGLSKNKNTDFICYIHAPFKDVNANIHPNKREVRIRNEDMIAKHIYKTVQDAIGNKRVSAMVLKSKIEEISKPVMTLQQADINLPLGKPVAIIRKNYVISETAKGMVMIDLHAAHERMILQKLLTQSESFASVSIEPVFVRLNTEQAHLLEEYEDLFLSYGFNFAETDDGCFVTQTPEYIELKKIADCVTDMISTLKQNSFMDARQELITEVCSTLACHNAFRTGDDSNMEEINMFLREMENTQFVAQCNHGRPTTIELEIRDIEKLFGR